MQTDPTIDAYNKYAYLYDEEVIEFWENFPNSFIDAFIAALPGKRILDLGSGSGRDALLLRERGLEVICLDGSKTMVGITTKLGFETHLSAFSELNFPLSSFDGVWAYTSLIHISKEEAKEVISKIHTLLKPRGVFVIGAIEGNTAGMVERKTMPDAARYFKNYSKKELQQLVKTVGFSLVYEEDYKPHRKIYLNQLYAKLLGG